MRVAPLVEPSPEQRSEMERLARLRTAAGSRGGAGRGSCCESPKVWKTNRSRSRWGHHTGEGRRGGGTAVAKLKASPSHLCCCDQSCISLTRSCRLSPRCEATSDERTAGNLHATFCGSRGAGDRPRPPGGDQRWSSLRRQLSHLSNAKNNVTGESCLLSLLTIAQPSPSFSQTFRSDRLPVLRHSAIIFCTRTQGRCNQYGMSEGILR